MGSMKESMSAPAEVYLLTGLMVDERYVASCAHFS